MIRLFDCPKCTDSHEYEDYSKVNCLTCDHEFKTNSPYSSNWIRREAQLILPRYSSGELTLRGLHYQLVSIGMWNDMKHYRKVVTAMIDARWDGEVDFEAFSDHDRSTIGFTNYEETEVETSSDAAKRQIKLWATSYHKNRWENQAYYPEIFIEKKALQGVFESVCRRWDVALNPCKGFPSLTFLNDAAKRFAEAEQNGFVPIMLYFGDYDPSGENIPKTIGENLERLGVVVEVRRIMLMKEQVLEWNLPLAPIKQGDSRTKNWDGLGQVELDSVEPDKIRSLCTEALEEIMDSDLYDDLKEQEKTEKEEFKEILRRDFGSLLDEE